MVSEYIYSPHYSFFIDKASRNKGYNMPSFHLHKKYEIYYQTKGVRRYFIKNATYIINPGDLVLIDTDEIHKTNSIENTPHDRYVINFSKEYISDTLESLDMSDMFSMFKENNHVISLLPKWQHIISEIIEEIWDYNKEDNLYNNNLKKIKLVELLIHVQNLSKVSKKPEKITNKTIEKIQEYIATDYSEDLSLKSIARKFFISSHYLSHLFKKTTGVSLIKYINSIRVLEAKQLLENTNLSVIVISDRVGFSTSGHFSRVFKEITGLSPQKYKKYYNKIVLSSY